MTLEELKAGLQAQGWKIEAPTWLDRHGYAWRSIDGPFCTNNEKPPCAFVVFYPPDGHRNHLTIEIEIAGAIGPDERWVKLKRYSHGSDEDLFSWIRQAELDLTRGWTAMAEGA